MLRFSKALQAMCILGALLTSGCGYGKVSPKTYDYAKGLYTICNLKQADKLDQASSMIEASLGNQEITSQEAGWLRGIVAAGKNGDWDKATQTAKSILSGQ